MDQNKMIVRNPLPCACGQMDMFPVMHWRLRLPVLSSSCQVVSKLVCPGRDFNGWTVFVCESAKVNQFSLHGIEGLGTSSKHGEKYFREVPINIHCGMRACLLDNEFVKQELHLCDRSKIFLYFECFEFLANFSKSPLCNSALFINFNVLDRSPLHGILLCASMLSWDWTSVWRYLGVFLSMELMDFSQIESDSMRRSSLKLH